jgi:acetolactate synthase I/II/III large subunit
MLNRTAADGRVMNGAESLVRTLVAGGVEVCFANPGTSEMHFVAALDRVEGMRCVLALFEGVVTGAADGYARMAEKPAATLLHLGPGLANGLANLHNAGKAATPVVNIIGDHATYHRRYDAPLTSDIETAARPFCGWVRTSPDARSVAKDGAEAIAAARTPPGKVAALILPADTAWNEADGIATVPDIPTRARVDAQAVTAAATVLRGGEPTVIVLGGPALRREGLELAGRIAAKTGAKLMAETFNARMERGAGRVPVDRIPYPVDQAVAVLAPFQHLILIGSKTPVAFFAYPNKPSLLARPDAQIHPLARREDDVVHALAWLADEVGARAEPFAPASYAPSKPATGKVTPEALAASIGALLPEQAIVVDEGVSTGRGFFPSTRGAHPHDWLQNMGGSIGIGPPLAVGAAVACPGRKVLNLEGDGSAMYTVQALWTQARENLDVTTVIFANRSYAILRYELSQVGAQNVGRKALDMLDLGRPDLDWVSLARGMGVPGAKVDTMDDFNKRLAEGLATPGPYLIEVVM